MGSNKRHHVLAKLFNTSGCKYEEMKADLLISSMYTENNSIALVFRYFRNELYMCYIFVNYRIGTAGVEPELYNLRLCVCVCACVCRF